MIVNPLRVKNWIVSELEASLVLYYTGRSRKSANIIIEQQRRLREGNADTMDRLHRIKAFVEVMKEQLLKGKIAAFADSLDHSWTEKRNVAGTVTNDFIDSVYAKVRAAGALGGKISGAGGGGFMMLICDPARRMDVIRTLEAEKKGNVRRQVFLRRRFAWRSRIAITSRLFSAIQDPMKSSPPKEFWRGKRVFLTGHTGFKGGWLSLWLRELGARYAAMR